MRNPRWLLSALCVYFALSYPLSTLAVLQPQEAPTPSPPANAMTSKPSAAEIAAAKASGRVWVNLDSRVYHKGGRWYGKTKNGKFMTEDEARKLGYKASKKE